ncbi:MAG TPA: hypothetical protein VLN49_05375 [Gemmatimonadaceae bacterium]|nr:hypothetical protein [Gemmatimonadaceae bacterium]
MKRQNLALRRSVVSLGLAAVAVAAGGCINTFWRTEARALRPAAADSVTLVRSPVKAHLADGSTVVFRHGASISGRRISGAGEAYALLGDMPTPRSSVPVDSVVGLETFEGKVLQAQTIAVSTAATIAGAAATVGLLKALFGSCPTVYADTGTGPVLEAEGFSYSIAPLLEHRDIDPLRAKPDADGTLRLDLRNEALETHYLNHIELASIRHAAGTRAVPDQSGRPVVVQSLRAPTTATDRAGRDILQTVARADGELFSSAASTVDAAMPGDLDDWIDLEASDLPAGDSVAVVLRLRNSLLNTVLLYDAILGGRDAPDWLADGLEHIATAVDLSTWYVRTMGMRASVAGIDATAGQAGAGTARLGDVGPLAFRDVAILLPRPERDARTVRIRLRFVADNWRIDQIAVAGSVTRPAVSTVALSDVVVPTPQSGVGPSRDAAALAALSETDDRYLETRPGQRMTLEFRTQPPAPVAGDSTTTYMIVWQGWYREWIRGNWLSQPTRTTPLVLGDSTVYEALRRWRGKQAEFERAFYASRVPVR